MIEDDEVLEDETEESAAPEAFELDEPAARKQPNALHEIQDWTNRTNRLLLRTISRLVRYTDFWEYRDGRNRERQLAHYRFTALLSLAMADLFTEYDDKRKAAVLQATVTLMRDLRAHPQYEPIRQRLTDVMRELKETKGIDGWAGLLEDAAAQEATSIGLFAKSVRDKQTGLDTILDRRSAKKGRGGEQATVHIVLPPSFESSRERALEIEAEILERRQKLLPEPAETIDASFIRVPEEAPREES